MLMTKRALDEGAVVAVVVGKVVVSSKVVVSEVDSDDELEEEYFAHSRINAEELEIVQSSLVLKH
jgi:hypothetical protein